MELENVKAELEDELEMAMNRIKKKTNNLNNAEVELEAMTSEIEELKRELIEFNKTCQTVTLERDNSLTKLEEVSVKLTNAENELKSLESEISAKTKELELSSNSNIELKSNFDDLSIKFDKSETDLMKHLKTISILEKTKKDLENQLNNKENSLNTTCNKLAILTTEFETAKQNWSSNNETQSTKITNLETIEKNLNKQLQETQNALQDTSTKLNDITSQFNKAQQEWNTEKDQQLATITTKTEELKSLQDNFNIERTNLEDKIVELETNLRKFDDVIQQQTNSLTEAFKLSAESEAQVTELEIARDELKTNLDRKLDEIISLTKTHEAKQTEMQSEIDNKLNELEALDNRFKKSEEDHETSRRQLARETESVRQLEEQLKSLKHEIWAEKQTNESLEGVVTDLQGKINDLELKCKELERIEELEEEIKKCKEKSSEQVTSITSLKTELDQTKSELQIEKDTINQLKDNYEKSDNYRKNRISELSNELEDKKAEFARLKNDEESLKEDVKEKDSKLNDIAAQIENIEFERHLMESRIAALNSQLMSAQEAEASYLGVTNLFSLFREQCANGMPLKPPPKSNLTYDAETKVFAGGNYWDEEFGEDMFESSDDEDMSIAESVQSIQDTTGDWDPLKGMSRKSFSEMSVPGEFDNNKSALRLRGSFIDTKDAPSLPPRPTNDSSTTPSITKKQSNKTLKKKPSKKKSKKQLKQEKQQQQQQRPSSPEMRPGVATEASVQAMLFEALQAFACLLTDSEPGVRQFVVYISSLLRNLLITSTPTEFEWIEDKRQKQCANCLNSFNLVRRKHHCRHCGNIFCKDCSNHFVPIKHYNLLGKERVCDQCYVVLSRFKNLKLAAPASVPEDVRMSRKMTRRMSIKSSNELVLPPARRMSKSMSLSMSRQRSSLNLNPNEFAPILAPLKTTPTNSTNPSPSASGIPKPVNVK
eukprot:TRINITY_DN4096_c0_g2_i2.p1 TRINITY_DN4096_c0_g2~~TRINITY_DN4096_c0_g2_i2.p1  ORF type:complete len:1053 (+),score=382.86 TRINITY_DN4096_c0_g2_i2:334-3159(+)